MQVTLTNKEVWKNKWQGRIEPVNVFAKNLVRRLGKGKGRKILDVGCGNGTDSLYFARHGFRVTATDFSEGGIEMLQTSAKQQNFLINTLFHDTAVKFPFEDRSFDVIYAHLALHYFDDPITRKICREMRRLLRPHGFFFVKCKSTDDYLYGEGECP